MKVVDVLTIETKNLRDAQFAYCPTCQTTLGSQYWSLAKSVYLHQNGTGHKVVLLKVAPVR